MARPHLDLRKTAVLRPARHMLFALLAALVLLLVALIALTGSRDLWVKINLMAQSHAAERGGIRR